MKPISYILVAAAALAGCRQPMPTVDIDGQPYPVRLLSPAVSLKKVRTCAVHRDQLEYKIIRIRVISTWRPGDLPDEAIIQSITDIAPNPIRFDRKEILSERSIETGRPRPGDDGSGEHVVEYCGRCEAIKRTELKKNEPNKAMETTPVDVTIPATQEVAPSTSVSHL